MKTEDAGETGREMQERSGDTEVYSLGSKGSNQRLSNTLGFSLVNACVGQELLTANG